ncbi:MAG TPA: symmetrical bis(5'-nucleosyl)-tetraphosphatase [Coxiellaceae bacterium]|nr:symmetrical bis(5'-nucleosyl)-tetraphosphatase [Coxiellaceae bacterium]
MATYIIGDVQGCFVELQNLLELIKFNPDKDRLGFAGDLVNRGPDSLEVLRFVKSLKDPIVVLGNHDLFLLSLAYHPNSSTNPHTLTEVLNAPDKLELLEWLRRQAFLYYDQENKYLLSHAGVAPFWELQETLSYAAEIQAALSGNNFRDFLQHLLGNQPACWDHHLTGHERLRFIVNVFTRMRLCTLRGCLDFRSKGLTSSSSAAYKPWFNLINPAHYDNNSICFGHWAALEGKTDVPNIYALDTGCAWGNSLTAMRIEDKQRFSVPAITK